MQIKINYRTFFRTYRKWVCAYFILAGSTVQAVEPVPGNQLEDIELKIWQSESEALLTLESQVSRRLQTNPYDIESFYLLSRIKLRQFNLNPREFDTTLRLATELGAHMIAIAPLDEKGYIVHSEALDALGRNVEAFTELAVLPSRGVKVSWRYFLGLARVTAETQPMETVLDYLKRAIEFPGANRNLIVPFAIASIDSAAAEIDSRSVFDSWSKLYPHPQFELKRAESLLEENAFVEATALFGDISRRHPELEEATINHAILLYEIFGKHTEARKALSGLLTRKNLSNIYKNLVFNHLGKIAVLEKNDPLALDLLWNAITLAENKDEVAGEISNWLKQAEKWSLRQSLLSKILGWGHVRGFLYADLGESFLKNRSLTKEAIQALENAVTLEPKNGDYHNALGLAHNQNGDAKTALQIFAKGLQTVGNHPEMLYNAACMQTKLGAFEEALSLLNRAVNLSPKLKELARQDPDLEPLRQRYAKTRSLEPSEKKASPSAISPAH